eukprot:5124746-Pyramimonas_sp.AAC.1
MPAAPLPSMTPVLPNAAANFTELCQPVSAPMHPRVRALTAEAYFGKYPALSKAAAGGKAKGVQ